MHAHLSHPKYRADIDGLRAIAVLPVVAFHAFPSRMPGGFIGVDIFFVISGFLISTIIFENLRNGTFSFSEFYARRISRIFPTLILVMLTSGVIGWFVMLPDEFVQLNKHMAGGASFASNFVLWNESGYFDGSAETKPLLHLWSLGIEEQFYILWPAILWLAWKKKFNLLFVTLIMAVGSFAANLVQIKVDPIATFYSPKTRFWELLCGSILAWTMLRKNDTGKAQPAEDSMAEIFFQRAHPSLSPSVIGAALLAFGFIAIHDGPSFPGFWAIVPVSGAMLMIAAGPHALLNKMLLAHKALVWVGKISFPLYLWHWPLLAMARTVEGGTPHWKIRVFIILLSTLLAWLTYKLVETPVRRSQNSVLKMMALTGSMAALGVFAFSAYKMETPPHSAKTTQNLVRQLGSTLPSASGTQASLCREMFPERLQMVSKERDDNFCFLEKPGMPNVVMVGDSMNLSLFPGVSGADGTNVLVLSASSAAPFYDTRTTNRGDVIRKNNFQLTNQALDYAANAENIKVVVLSFLAGPAITDPNIPFDITNINQPDDRDANSIFTRAFANTLKKLTNHGKSVIFVLPNPILTFDIKSCLNEYRPFTLSRQPKKLCADSYPSFMKHGGDAYHRWVHSVLKDFPEVEVFDLAKEVCDTQLCWGMKDGKILFRDSSHLSIEGSQLVTPKLNQMITRHLKKPLAPAGN